MENDDQPHELLRSYADAAAPSPARKEAALAALLATTAAAPVGGLRSGIGKLGMAVLVMGALGAAGWLGSRGAEPAPVEAPSVAAPSVAVVTTAEPVPSDTPPSPHEASPIAAEAPSVVEGAATPTRPRARTAIDPAVIDLGGPTVEPPAETEDAPLASTLAAELAILRQAQQAIRGGDAAAALRALDDHLERFPDGALARDRDIARVGALCALDRDDEARRLAAVVDASLSSPAIARALSRCGAGSP